MFQTRIRQDRAFRIRVEEEEFIFNRGKAPSEAMSGIVTYTPATAILYAGLALEERIVYRDESVLTMLFVTVHTIA